MPNWLIDDPTNVLFVLALLAIALGVLWWVRRSDDFGKKKVNWIKGLITCRVTLNQFCAMGLTLIAFLAIAELLLYFFVPTDQKRIESAIQEMSDGVRQNNVDKIFAQISDRFSNKESFRPVVKHYTDNGDITEVAAWDFEQARFNQEKTEATIEFMIRPKGNMTHSPYRCVATFVKDPDRQWRLRGFRVFQPQIDPAVGQPIYTR
jgi:uncharacterized protein YjeT (DUF2065 family)